jgi:Kef-type K+ transport system membrane component KefB
MQEDTFLVFALVLVLAAFGGLLSAKLRQPVIVAFIGIGVLVGPVGLGWVVGEGPIDLFAKLGISLLLFLVG